MMTGIPVVSIGPAHFDIFEGHDTFEGHELAGLWADDPSEARLYLRELLADYDYATYIGIAGRERAIELFGRETIGAQWRAFLGAP